MNNNRTCQALDLRCLEIRRGYWFFDRDRGVLSNSVRIRQPVRRKVYLKRRAPGDPVRQYYYLESLCLIPAERADRIGRFINGKSGQRLIRFLDGKNFRAVCWAVIIAAALYFGVGIFEWATR